MPIEKFVRVKNVGRFIDLAAAGDVAFRRLTLIYGDNGTGKTTIAGILRSMKSGDSAHIAERQTVGSTTPVEVDVKVSNAGLLKFRNGSWDTIKNEIEIFDSVFVAENVYAGELVESEHRRNLYQVVVGDTAVALAKRIDEIDSESRAAARAITDLESKIREKMQAPFDLDDFIMLQKADANELSQKIEDRTAQLVAARKSKDVLNRSPLEELQFPASPRDLLKPLTTSVATISKQTEDRVKEHLRLRLDRNGEQWLRQGLAYVQKDNTCPFCTQSLTGTDIVKCFSEHFSTQYKEHVVEVQRLSNEISQRFAEDRLSRIRRIALENEGRIAVWKDLVDLTYATSSIDSLESRWKNVRDTLSQVIAAKLSNPGEAISNWDLVEAAIQDYEASIAEAAAHNNAIKRANSDITRIKKDAASANEGSLETDLRKLRNTEIRHEPDVAFLCTDITSKRTDKARLEGEKIKVREQLTTQSEALLADYENDINKMLEAIGSTFKITGVKPSFAGGKASSTYKIQINGQALDLGDARTPPGTPCFRTALSSGDKSALALAFFLVRLRRDSAIASKIVVFDDPFTSMDCFRRTFTKQEIARMAGIAKQVIVLSHDPSFLKDLRDSSTSATVKSLRVKRSSTTYTVSEFDIEQHCLPQAQRDFFVLTSFIEDGLPDGSDLGTVARSIRPFVENSIRSRFPELPGGIMLGDIITRARESKATEPIAALKKDLLDLEGINDYSKRFHHPSNETPNDQELRTFAQRAIQLNRGS